MISSLAVVLVAAFAQQPACEALKALPFPNTTITAAEFVAAGQQRPGTLRTQPAKQFRPIAREHGHHCAIGKFRERRSVEHDAAAGGHHRPREPGGIRHRLSLHRPERLLSKPAEDLRDGHPDPGLDTAVQVEERQLEPIYFRISIRKISGHQGVPVA